MFISIMNVINVLNALNIHKCFIIKQPKNLKKKKKKIFFQDFSLLHKSF